MIVGLGSIGKRHLRNILAIENTKKLEIIIYSKQTKSYLSNYKNIKIFDTLDKCLLEKPDVGFITNETVHHIPIAIKLAKVGLDLFIEKPLSNKISNVKTFSKIIKTKKLITLVGCNLRFHRCINEIKNLIDQKVIGDIISVKVECGTYLPDWHPNEDYSKSYASRDDLGGGVVLTCIHELDYLYWFFGETQEVFSMTGVKTQCVCLKLPFSSFPIFPENETIFFAPSLQTISKSAPNKYPTFLNIGNRSRNTS